jgi:hypothetical protein
MTCVTVRVRALRREVDVCLVLLMFLLPHGPVS